MKQLLMLAGLLALPSTAPAQVWVKGYMKADGTYVMPHMKTRPNGTVYDNYSYTPKRYVSPYAPKPIKPYRYEPYKPPCYYNCK